MTLSPVEAIAAAYVQESGGDPEEALRAAIADALADLTEWERRTRRAERLVSRGYARGLVGGGIADHGETGGRVLKPAP
ncbi:hypothetical protein [Salinarimonas soli]|nr:hypothetical protein [Salinarimonas soli]